MLYNLHNLHNLHILQGKEKPVVVYSVLPYDREATQPLERLDLTKARGAKGPRTPLGRVSDEGEGAEEDEAGPERPLVGRSDEMATILARAAGVVDGTGPGGAVVIEGHTGVWGGRGMDWAVGC